MPGKPRQKKSAPAKSKLADKQAKIKEQKAIELQCYENKILKDSGRIIKTIYHISDIHIHMNNRRYAEYKIVFERLYEEIKKDLTDAIIVLTGDIIDSNSHLHADQVEFLKDFFVGLTNLTDLIVIIGNHDINVQGNHQDSISANIKYLQTKHDIHLLLKGGLYTYENIIFGLTTMSSTVVTPCDITTNKIKVGLYHGMVGHCKTAEQFDLYSRAQFDVSDFTSQYDLTMLGDIHLFQYLNSEKTIAYPSSLIQLSFGEDLLNHGMIKWNLLDKSSEFIRIKNDHGFVELTVNENGLSEIPEQMPPNPEIRLYYSNITSTKVDEYIANLTRKYNAKCTSIQNLANLHPDISIGESNNNLKLTGIKSDQQTKQIIMDHLARTDKDIDEAGKLGISKELDEILTEIKTDYDNQDKKYTLKNVKWDNFYIYTEGNEVDFDLMYKIYALCGPKGVGKSTFIDIMMYGSFGEIIRVGSKITDIVNVNKDHMHIEITFTINSDTYIIDRRRRVLSENRSTELVVLTRNGQNISEKDTPSTNEMIKKIICEPEILLSTCIMLQDNCKNFTHLSDTDKRNMICKLLKLDIFSNILEKAKTHKRSKNMIQKRLHNPKKAKSPVDAQLLKLKTAQADIICSKQSKQTAFDSLLTEIDCHKSQLMEHNAAMKFLDKSITEAKKLSDLNAVTKAKVEHLTKELSSLDTKLKTMTQQETDTRNKLSLLNGVHSKNPTEIIQYNNEFETAKQSNIKSLEDHHTSLLKRLVPKNSTPHNIKQLTKDLNAKNELLKNLTIKLSSNDTEVKKLSNLIEKEPFTEEMKINYEKHEQLIQQQSENETALSQQTEESGALAEKITELNDHEFNKDCTACMKNPVTKDKIRYQNQYDQLGKSIKSLKQKIKKISQQIIKLEPDAERYQTLLQIQQQNIAHKLAIKSITDQNNLIDKDIQIHKHILTNLENSIKEHQRNIDIDRSNKEIEKQCSETQQDISKIKASQNKEYIDYLKYAQDKTQHENLLKELLANLTNSALSIKQTQMELDIHSKNLAKEGEYTKLLSQHASLQKNITFGKSKLSILETKKSELSTELNTLSNQLFKSEVDIAKEQHIVDEYHALTKELERLTKIENLLGTGGLVDKILSQNIIPKLQETVNSILRHIADYTVKISYYNGQIEIIKLTSDSKKINIATNSGCEDFIANVSFRLALANYNNYLRTNFFIFDESFKYCDQAFLDSLPKLLDYINIHYTWAIIISHDSRIISLLDNKIKIKSDKDGSRLTYVTHSSKQSNLNVISSVQSEQTSGGSTVNFGKLQQPIKNDDIEIKSNDIEISSSNVTSNTDALIESIVPMTMVPKTKKIIVKGKKKKSNDSTEIEISSSDIPINTEALIESIVPIKDSHKTKKILVKGKKPKTNKISNT